MNGLESAYAEHLKTLQQAGLVDWFAFECIKLKLAEATHYTPDFMVLMMNGDLEVHEVKGFWEDDARVKIKVAAALFPFRFRAIRRLPKKDGGGWDVESFP